MRPVVMVIADVLVHQAFQMAFIESDNVVEQIAAAVADPNARRHSSATDCGNWFAWDECRSTLPCRSFFIELCAAIKDQVAGRRM